MRGMSINNLYFTFKGFEFREATKYRTQGGGKAGWVEPPAAHLLFLETLKRENRCGLTAPTHVRIPLAGKKVSLRRPAPNRAPPRPSGAPPLDIARLG